MVTDAVDISYFKLPEFGGAEKVDACIEVPFGWRSAHYPGRGVFLGPASISTVVQSSSPANLDRSYVIEKVNSRNGKFAYGVRAVYNNRLRGKPLTNYQKNMQNILEYWAIMGIEFDRSGFICGSNGVQTGDILYKAAKQGKFYEAMYTELKRHGYEPDDQDFPRKDQPEKIFRGMTIKRINTVHNTARIAGLARFDESDSKNYRIVGTSMLGAIFRSVNCLAAEIKTIDDPHRPGLGYDLRGITTYRDFDRPRRRELRLVPNDYSEPNMVLSSDKKLVEATAGEINEFLRSKMNPEVTAGVATLKMRKDGTPEIAIWNYSGLGMEA